MKLQIKLTVKEIFTFSMYHIYHSRMGVFSLVAGVGAAIFGAWQWAQVSFLEKFLLFLCVFFFLLWEPLKNLAKAKVQEQQNQKPVDYVFGEDGITASQGKGRQKVEWKTVVKLVKTSSLYIIYISEVRAFLIPSAAVAENRDEFEQILKGHVAAEKRKGL